LIDFMGTLGYVLRWLCRSNSNKAN
jgi:hypothetical protein